MRTISRNQAVDAGRLDQELKAACGASASLATGPGIELRCFVDDVVTDMQVDGVLAAHVPTPLPDALVVDEQTAKQQAGANPLDGLTVTQALAWIDANVTDLPTARTALKQMVKIVAIHERRLRIIERALSLPIGGS